MIRRLFRSVCRNSPLFSAFIFFEVWLCVFKFRSNAIHSFIHHIILCSYSSFFWFILLLLSSSVSLSFVRLCFIIFRCKSNKLQEIKTKGKIFYTKQWQSNFCNSSHKHFLKAKTYLWLEPNIIDMGYDF